MRGIGEETVIKRNRLHSRMEESFPTLHQIFIGNGRKKGGMRLRGDPYEFRRIKLVEATIRTHTASAQWAETNLIARYGVGNHLEDKILKVLELFKSEAFL